jgi:hypothetical protein
MDNRMKVGISLFAIVIISYSFYYIYSEFNKLENKDKFVEGYVDGEKSVYDERVEMLNIIDKLEIDDKDIKGKLLEKLMTKESLDMIKNYTKEQKTEYIKNILILIKNKNTDGESETFTEVNDTKKIMTDLKNIEKELENIKKIIKKNTDETFYNDPIIPEIKVKTIEEKMPTIVNQEKEVVKEHFEDKMVSIIGWENIRHFAEY